VNVLYTFSGTLGGGVGLVRFRSRTEICALIFISQVFSPAKVIFAGVGVLLSVCIHPPLRLRARHSNAYISQAAKDVRASQDTLIDVFEHIEMFFRRLDVYTGVAPTNEMTDLIIQIMVEVLSILGIATERIKQGRMSKFSPY
jgi:hypothetical protein